MFDLSEFMEFDRVIRSNGDGTFEHVPGVYAPEVNLIETESGTWELEELSGGWTFLIGFSGQDGYGGPLLHTSEYIGGGLAEHIAKVPGLYAVVAAFPLPLDDDDDSDPDSWVVVYREDDGK